MTSARLIFLIAATFLYSSLSTSANSQNVIDEAFYLTPTSIYFPATYCGWDRNGLPEKYQKICKKYDNKFLEVGTHFHAEFLKKKNEKSEGGSEQPVSQAGAVKLKRTYNPNLKIRGHAPEWVEFESDVGAIFSVDMKSISRPFGTDPNARMRGYTYDEPAGDWVNIVEVIILGPEYEMLWYRFNCKGRAAEIKVGGINYAYIPPRSVMGGIERIVCKDKIY